MVFISDKKFVSSFKQVNLYLFLEIINRFSISKSIEIKFDIRENVISTLASSESYIDKTVLKIYTQPLNEVIDNLKFLPKDSELKYLYILTFLTLKSSLSKNWLILTKDADYIENSILNKKLSSLFPTLERLYKSASSEDLIVDFK